MKIFAAALATETNTFSPLPTGLKNYDIIRPEDITEGGDGYVGYAESIGILEKEVLARGYDFVFGMYAFAQPAGATLKSTYEVLRDELLERLQAAMPVNGVFLDLHGAMVAQGYDDCEEDMVQRVRAIVGPDAVIGVELDLHCHLSQPFIDEADVVVIYKEYPHTDTLERGKELLTLILDTIEGKVKPTMALYDCKMMGLYLTPVQPVRGFVDEMMAAEGKDGVLSLSLGHGFPWGDVAHNGTKMLAVTDNNIEQAAQVAEDFGSRFFAMRHEADSKPTPLDVAFDQALAVAEGPVVMADVTDNPGGGAPSDSTFALAEMLKRGVTNAGIAMFWDPIVVQVVMSAEVGDVLELRLGGKMGVTSGDPLDITAEVIGMIPDMHQTWSQEGDTLHIPCGDSVALRCEGIDIIVCSKRGQVLSPTVFTNFGIDVTEKKLLVVKSTQHFYAEYAPLASEVIYMSAPGTLQMDYTKVPFTKVDTHKYPWVDDPFKA